MAHVENWKMLFDIEALDTESEGWYYGPVLLIRNENI